jgi:hypothetical protein
VSSVAPEAVIGTIKVMLRCRACYTVSGPAFVTAFLDDDGDVAVTVEDIGWFVAVHLMPVVETAP